MVALAAALAWRAGALTLPGAVAAWGVGTLVLWGTGWNGGAVLAAFFVPSTWISRAAPAPAELDPKEGRRDARQVLANGGVAAAVALLGRQDPDLGLWLVTGALAAAAADTWATSVGATSRVPPRLIWSGRPVPRGTSGGVTLKGSLGALAGALVVGAAAAAVGGPSHVLPAAVLIGFAGMLVDSSLGAWAQARFHCPACDRPSEWPVHRCGAVTEQRGGVRWLDNDAVNLLATGTAALLAFAVWSAR